MSLLINETLSAADASTEEVLVRGEFDVSVSGTFTAGSVDLERSLSDTDDFNSCGTFTADDEQTGKVVVSYIRFTASSDFEGSVLCKVSQ